MLHLYPQLLNSRHYRSHHVATAAVKGEERNDMMRRIGNAWFEYTINPHDHNPLIHPGIVLASVVVCCWVCAKLCSRDPTIWFPLKNICRLPVKFFSLCVNPVCKFFNADFQCSAKMHLLIDNEQWRMIKKSRSQQSIMVP